MTGLGQFMQLTPSERRLFIRAVSLIAFVQLSLRAIPFRMLHKHSPGLLSRIANPVKLGALPPERVVWLVRVASRFIPGAHCLARAVTAQLLLARQGYMTQLRIGARKSGDKLDAHAWLELKGVPLLETYEELSDFMPFGATNTLMRNVSKGSQ